MYVHYGFLRHFLISYRSCLHPLHLIGCFPMYLHSIRSSCFFVFFVVVFLERFADFF